MSSYHKNDSFVDTRFLRDHVYKLREEKKIAFELYSTVSKIRSLSKPEVSYRYTSILREINQMIEYFEGMERALSQIEDEAVRLSFEIGEMIEDDTERTRRTSSQSFLL